MSGKVIVVEGAIGAGKSTFCNELKTYLGESTLLFTEPDEENNANPYLADYYTDPAKWAFTMQAHLLQARFKIHKHAQWHVMNNRGHAVVDRSYMGDTAFAALQVEFGYMSEREFETYKSIYHAMTASVLLPNICVHLEVKPETSLSRINRRMQEKEGRVCETSITAGYLQSLDREIRRVVSVLDKQGVNIIPVDWNQDRDFKERQAVISAVAENILNTPKHDLLDLHRRTI